MADYNFKKLPLDVAKTFDVVSPGTRVGSIGIEKLPVAAVGNVELQIGEGEDWIMLRFMGRIYAPVGGESDGIRLRVLNAVPGETVELLVGYTLELVS